MKRTIPLKTSKNYSYYLLSQKGKEGEFFTLKSNGYAGMTARGLARFLELPIDKIVRLIKEVEEANPYENSLPDILNPFAGKILTLIDKHSCYGRAIYIDSFCTAIVRHLASLEPPLEKSSQLQKALKITQTVGLRELIRLKTGWHPDCTDEEFEEIMVLPNLSCKIIKTKSNCFY